MTKYRWRLHEGMEFIGYLEKRWLGVWWTIKYHCSKREAEEYIKRYTAERPYHYFESE